jgi:spermidine synthase
MAVYRETDGFIVREYALDQPNLVTITSRRQSIDVVSTKEYGDCLFLDGELQLSARDEYIYHEMLVHPAMNAALQRSRILIIGGGDGCAAREVLKWPGVEQITLIDWDSDVVQLFSHRYAYMNNGSLQDPRVHIRCQDIRELVDEQFEFDVILIDLKDPNPDVPSSDQLWRQLIRAARRWLSPRGSLVVNAGGVLPWKTEVAEWVYSLIKTEFQGSSMTLLPYKVFVPSFGKEWCFCLLTPRPSSSFTIQHNYNNNYIDEVIFQMACKWSFDFRDRLCPVNLSPPRRD